MEQEAADELERIQGHDLGSTAVSVVLQEEFAHISGLHRTYIGQIERGEKNISFGNLSKISGVLGVTLSELLSGLEDGEKLVVKSSRRQQSGDRSMKIQKLVRQLRVQQAAADRAVSSLEELVFPSSAAKLSATRRRKPGSGKANRLGLE